MLTQNEMLTIGIPCTLVGLGVPLLLVYQYFVSRRLQTMYADMVVRKFPNKGDVRLVYDTYHGVLFYGVRTNYDFWMAADDARTLLDRLLWFNLTWGLFTLLFFLVHPLSLFHYFWQRQSIASQEASGGAQPMTAEIIPETRYDHTPPADPSNPYNAPRADNPEMGVPQIQPSVPLFYRGLGALLMLVCGLGMLGVILNLALEKKPVSWGEMAGVFALMFGLTFAGYRIFMYGI